MHNSRTLPPLVVLSALSIIALAPTRTSAEGDRAGVVEATPKRRDPVSGFHMEGAAEVELVFGDSDYFRTHVDRFFALDANMNTLRTSFSQHVQAALAALAAAPGRGCPADAVAPFYARASSDGESYRTLGAEFETQYHIIRRLDALGETAGLTPDYRWRINRVRGLYRQALADYREMRLAFTRQLQREVGFRRCDQRKLRVGASAAALPDDLAVNPALAYKPRRNQPQLDPIPASSATFFVANLGCDEILNVYIDGARVGDVAADAKEVFQALAGRHSMCLLPASSTASCGQQGTMRTAYIHDGWSISLHCLDQAAPSVGTKADNQLEPG